MPRCARCPAPAKFGEDLCVPCAIVLTCNIMASEPDAEHRYCKVCNARIRYTEARVIRHAQHPNTGSKITPYLCWVCAHLHVQAHQPDKSEHLL